MSAQAEKAARFLELHRQEAPLLLPNPWDQGSAKLLVSLGFDALGVADPPVNVLTLPGCPTVGAKAARAAFRS